MIGTMHRMMYRTLPPVARAATLALVFSIGAPAVAKKPKPAKPKPVAADVSAASLEAHNRERKKAGVPPLKWDGGLAKLASDWARHLCRGGKGLPSLQHRPQRENSPGENLWAGATSEATGYPVAEAVRRWAEEVRYYDGRSGTCKGGVCGHYTQLVWRDSTHVGCGVATCSAAGLTATVWACNYRPAGNIVGEKPF
jgi:pathogenesis-related protein 1